MEKIHQLVNEGVTVVSEMKHALDHYVKNDLCQDSPPDPNDRAYHPSNNDIKNHMSTCGLGNHLPSNHPCT